MRTEKADVLENQSHGSIVSDGDRSSEQEWTRETVESFWDASVTKPEFFRRVANAHNAALAAERQRNPPYETVCETLMLLQTFHEPGESNCLIDLANKVVSQLLSAQAAIEKIRIACTNPSRLATVFSDDIKRACDQLDLSLLHQHDTEVREPLVDLLRKARRKLAALKSFIESGESLNDHDKSRLRDLFGDIDAALA